jgi:hypothetical protein
MNIREIKPRIREIFKHFNIEVFKDGMHDKIHCLVHADGNPSALVNKNGTIKCYGCGAVYDIFDTIGFIKGVKDFSSQLKYACEILNIQKENVDTKLVNRENRKLFRGHKKHTEFVPVTLDIARGYVDKNGKSIPGIYNKSRIREILAYSKIDCDIDGNGFPFLSESGMVNCVDFRILEKTGKKHVITFWFDGQSVKIKNPPSLIWGLDHIDTEKPCLIVEGAKCAKLAHEKLGNNFSIHTWNRGCEGAKYCDWDSVSGFKEYYLFYDYDQKLDKTGNLMSPERQPGTKVMNEISDTILEVNNDAIFYFIPPCSEAISYKNDGADIVEHLMFMSAEDTVEYILSYAHEYGKTIDGNLYELPF